MLKHDELTKPDSCLNKARADEMLFVLLERDPASTATIRFWAEERIRLGKNVWADPQIQEALACAAYMARQRHARNGGDLCRACGACPCICVPGD